MNKKAKAFEPDDEFWDELWSEDEESLGEETPQQRYFKTPNGKKALEKAREKYDKNNQEKRRKQKRDYMRRKREKDPDVWR